MIIFHRYLRRASSWRFDLMIAGTPEATALRSRHLNGEFDATLEEGEEWAKSPEGQEAFASLTKKNPGF